MSLKHILKIIVKHRNISLMILIQIAIAVTIVGNASFISYGTLKNWLIPSHLDEYEILNVYTKVFDNQVDKSALIQRDLSNLSALPEVTQVTYASNELVLATVSGSNQVYKTTDQEEAGIENAQFDITSEGVATLGLTITQGRDFYPNEFVFAGSDQGRFASVALISEALAKSLFGEQSALGQTVYLQRARLPYRVVGVYANKMLGESAVYEQHWYHSTIVPQAQFGSTDVNYLLRVKKGTSEAILKDVEDALYQQGGRIVERVEFAARAKKRLWDGRSTFAFIMIGISVIAVAVTTFGIIGLVSFSVSIRKKDIGILRALGASQSTVLKTLLIENALLAMAGILLGSFAALWLNNYFVTHLRAQGLVEPWLAVMVAISVWLLSAVAVYIPVRKAAKIAPARVTKT
ncbi:ABC transporter permease [Pseudoalteromonas rubra]|uniref:ABC transporter permease n=1 Tax=Pseudoalteromonas rubra TaxID=43658 RepID=A0A5S3WL97_9GAMM|nr:FtsX-like permease family protein [Pseudoalteromonas rubra]TMP27520.1 ABC transporter permease [Pseudoalteromonas rubra]TMP28960.1 ABC transporter permease [Pseudoalteromonas rubra]